MWAGAKAEAVVWMGPHGETSSVVKAQQARGKRECNAVKIVLEYRSATCTSSFLHGTFPSETNRTPGVMRDHHA
jgi:hypothetical protein